MNSEIEKETKFLKFVQHYSQTNEDITVTVFNKKATILGVIYYHKQWKKFVFSQADEGIVFDAICLREISDYLICLTGHK